MCIIFRIVAGGLLGDRRREPRLDLSKVTLPLDGLTWGAIRTRQPKLFKDGHDIDFEQSGAALAYYLETCLAHYAFDMALRGSSNAIQGTPEELEDMLNEKYVAYRISAGPHQTRQLVRDFMEAAANQARSARDLPER